jgi:hypothetical protein
MSAVARDILARLAAVGARVEWQGDRLLLRVGPRPVPLPLIAEARGVKPELLRLLAQSGDQHRRLPGAIDAQLPENEHLWQEANKTAAEMQRSHHRCSSFCTLSTYEGDEHLWCALDPEERAAIIAEGASVSRAWAEGYAALCAIPPPVGFMPERWNRIIDATGAFLDRWAREAVRCGWTDLDVFGCDPDRPTARFDCMGLVLLLDRCEVAAIDSEGADLVTASGARQRFRRRPLPPGTDSLWQ